MRKIKVFIELIIVLIALGAALYTQRVPVLEWYREVTAPELPESMTYEEVQVEQGEDAEEVVNDVEDLEEIEEPAEDEEEILEEVVEFVEENVSVDESSVEVEEEETEEAIALPASINLAVPFTAQAPHANWDYPYKEACEEASVYMVHRYYEGEPEGLIDPDKADADLLSIVEFENSLFGYYEDTTTEQTSVFAELMYGFSGVEMIEDPTVDQIKEQLAQGRPVIVPAAGRLLGNPYFTAPGPLYHMLVIRGYTPSNQFIVNDPGTYRGEAYLYDFDTLMNAMHDWNNGDEITEGKKVVLVLSP